MNPNNKYKSPSFLTAPWIRVAKVSGSFYRAAWEGGLAVRPEVPGLPSQRMDKLFDPGAVARLPAQSGLFLLIEEHLTIGARYGSRHPDIKLVDLAPGGEQQRLTRPCEVRITPAAAKCCGQIPNTSLSLTEYTRHTDRTQLATGLTRVRIQMINVSFGHHWYCDEVCPVFAQDRKRHV